MKRVLIVEDDTDMSRLIEYHLKQQNYEVVVVNNGEEGLARALSESFSLIVLDVQLPGKDGLEICKTLRQEKRDVPIIMLTERSTDVDKVLGLELGADDYHTKPFSVIELVARIKALIRRSEKTHFRPDEENLPPEIVFGPLAIEIDKRRASLNGTIVQLTAKEFDLLAFLAAHPGRPFTREELLTHIWNYETNAYEHTVSSHINRLRAKIEIDQSQPKFILTVWGHGYRFAERRELVASTSEDCR